MGNIVSTSLPKEEKEDDDGWVLVQEDDVLAEAKGLPQEKEEEKEEKEEEDEEGRWKEGKEEEDEEGRWKEEEEEEEEEEESTLPPPHNTIINYPPLPHPEYNPWPWSPGLPCPAEVEYWSDVTGVHLTEAELQAWERIAQEYGLKNSY